MTWHPTADVGLAWTEHAAYPKAPFHPPRRYDELLGSASVEAIDESNAVFPLVRQALFNLFGAWDSVSDQVDIESLRACGAPRNILVKPNWVLQDPANTQAVVTHGSVLRATLDYLLLAFPAAQITVADIPLQSSDLAQTWRQSGVDELQDHYARHSLPVRFLDFRQERLHINAHGFVERTEKLAGDPLGYRLVSLKSKSFLETISGRDVAFSVNDYEPGATECRHRPGEHAYYISGSALAADLFVSVPKLKTHCKAGMTGCMKNLIGINGDKGWIPHFRQGAPADGGDEYDDKHRHMMVFKSRIKQLLQRRSRLAYNLAYSLWSGFRRSYEKAFRATLTSGGAWPGNDTLWRSILDLVEVITYADSKGELQATPQRAQLFIVDGIVCGEAEGPLHPTPRNVGAILTGTNAICTDWAMAHIAGFDWRAIPQLAHAWELPGMKAAFPNGAQDVHVNAGGQGRIPLNDCPVWRLVPPKLWKGHTEK